MDHADREELDDLILGRALQHDYRLGWSVTGTGQRVFKWRRRGQDVGVLFDSRLRALDWMADWLDHTPSEGLPRSVLQ
jgi:hypothetical protein